ncbi:PREDICTED: platelet factor 4 [Chrysochloris asiatica]|uniref:Multifunctional fusion protein n=1 Tax=Chrysochloris asiatica TaxID=185453 RepID=A0A9B0U1B3_CHRAS|nr:PREDICTED: platelet factor 4 [Chrysochloris asiatica]
MNQLRSTGTWHTPSSLGLLFLGLLLLPAMVASASDTGEKDSDLHCLCVRTTSTVHPKHVNSLEVIRAGLHCPKVQLIATLKNGRKICLDQQAPIYKKIIKKLLKN